MIRAFVLAGIFAAVSVAAFTAPLWVIQRETRSAVYTPAPIPNLKGRLP